MIIKSKLAAYRSGAVEPLSDFINEPYNHNAFDWTSQDSSRTNIQDLDDGHLVNIFKKLVKEISLCELQLDEGMFTLDLLRDTDLFKEQQQFIGHEIYKRGILINKLNKQQCIN